MQMTRSKKGGRTRGARGPKPAGAVRYSELPEMEWIAIVRDEIVAHARTFKEVRQMVAARQDHANVVFSRVLPRGPQAW